MTTERFKDFGNTPPETAPLSFKLYDQNFDCKPSLQGKILLDMVKIASSKNEGEAAELVDTFFAKALLPESLERFETLMADSEKIVTVELMGEITSWLVEQYSGRPTSGPTVSSSGQ